MGKKSRAKKASSPATRPPGESGALIQFIAQLIREKRFDEAMRAAMTLLDSDPRNPLAHAILGSMFAQTDQPADATRHYEMAIRLGLTDDVELYRSLAVTSSQSGLPFHALQAARSGARVATSPEWREIFTNMITSTESFLRQLTTGMDIQPAAAERAMLAVESATRAAQAGEPDRARQRAIEATQEAPGWAVPWNNLSMLQFSLDEIDEAIGTCERGTTAVGHDAPMLLSSMVRYLAVTGRIDEANATQLRLSALGTGDSAVSIEIAKGHAILDNDQQVYDALQPLVEGADELVPVGRFLLGVAAANLGKRDEARTAWRNLARQGLIQVRAYTDMMARNEELPTPGSRYPYFAAAEMVPGKVLDSLFTAAQSSPDGAGVKEASRQFPYLKLALCETYYAPIIDPRLAVELLIRLEDESVVAATERFASSRLLGDYDRLYAHLALRGTGLRDAESPASVWLGGRRRDMALPRLRVHPPEAPAYEKEIAALMIEGAEAQQQDNPSGAVEIYRRILTLDPTIQEAEHNLGTALLLSNQMEEGEQHLRRSLEIDEGYVLARCNLASLELSRGNLTAAQALLEPLEKSESFTLEEVIAYLRTRSDIATAQQDWDVAEQSLHCLLAYDHDNELAKERLARLATMVTGKAGESHFIA